MPGFWPDVATADGLPAALNAVRALAGFEVHAAHVVDGELLPLPRGVVPQQCVAADHIDETSLLRAAVAHDEHLSATELRQFGCRRLSAGEVDDRDLIDRKSQVFTRGGKIEIPVDQVLSLVAVSGDRAALSFAVGQDEVRPLLRGERIDAGARDENC